MTDRNTRKRNRDKDYVQRENDSKRCKLELKSTLDDITATRKSQRTFAMSQAQKAIFLARQAKEKLHLQDRRLIEKIDETEKTLKKAREAIRRHNGDVMNPGVIQQPLRRLSSGEASSTGNLRIPVKCGANQQARRTRNQQAGHHDEQDVHRIKHVFLTGS